jgi:hypothetical protein
LFGLFRLRTPQRALDPWLFHDPPRSARRICRAAPPARKPASRSIRGSPFAGAAGARREDLLSDGLA